MRDEACGSCSIWEPCFGGVAVWRSYGVGEIEVWGELRCRGICNVERVAVWREGLLVLGTGSSRPDMCMADWTRA